MWRSSRPAVESMWLERALFGASVCAIGLLLGPGKAIVDAILGPATDVTGPLTWLQDLTASPEDAFVRVMTALGIVLAVRLTAALLLALGSWIPGPTAAGAARLGRFLAPPLTRRYIDVLIGISLTSGTGAAMSPPAFAATAPAATVVPSPVLAPPEAILQTWPDLGRPGTDLPALSAPDAKVRNWPDLGRPGTDLPSSSAPDAKVRNWPDLGRPGTDVPTSTAPSPTNSLEQLPNGSSSQPPTAHPDKPAVAAPTAGPATTRPPATARPRPEIVVTPGDCLWTLAERDLDNRSATDPSDSEIAAATEKWWLANRTVIGTNPDRLLPGQRLHPPA